MSALRSFVCARVPAHSPWPRGVWKRAYLRARRRVVRASLHALDVEHALSLLTSEARTTGCSTLDLRPKGKGGFRTIYNLTSATALPRKCSPSLAVSCLLNTHHHLHIEYAQQGSKARSMHAELIVLYGVLRRPFSCSNLSIRQFSAICLSS